LPLFAWGKYEGQLKQAIASLKYEKHPEIGELMGTWLGETWLKTLPLDKNQKLTIIPIPLHPQKLKERGFNQAEAIARGFCQVTGYNLNKQGLIRCKDTAPLFSLSPQERQKNMQGAFRVSISFQKRLSTTPILLIDDIYTTGITAREASRILRAVGINVLGITVIAMVKS
jgi:ComF family protein